MSSRGVRKRVALRCWWIFLMLLTPTSAAFFLYILTIHVVRTVGIVGSIHGWHYGCGWCFRCGVSRRGGLYRGSLGGLSRGYCRLRCGGGWRWLLFFGRIIIVSSFFRIRGLRLLPVGIAAIHFSFLMCFVPCNCCRRLRASWSTPCRA